MRAGANDKPPRVLLGTARCAERNPDAIVVDPSMRAVYGLRLDVQMFPQSTRMLAILMLNFGRHVSYDDICEALWAHRADGGPLAAKRVIWRYICDMRRGLKGSSLAISTFHSQGLMLHAAAEAWPMQRGVYYPRRAQSEIRA